VRLGRIVTCATVAGMDTGNNKLEILLRLVGPWRNNFCVGSEKAIAMLLESAGWLCWDAACKETGRYIRSNHACEGVDNVNNELEMPVVHSCHWLGKQNNVALSASCCVAVHAMDKGWHYCYPSSARVQP